MFAKINAPVKIVQPELQGLDSVQKLLTGERSLYETHKLGYRTGLQSAPCEGIVRTGQLPQHGDHEKDLVSEVGYEPTPTMVSGFGGSIKPTSLMFGSPSLGAGAATLCISKKGARK